MAKQRADKVCPLYYLTRCPYLLNALLQVSSSKTELLMGTLSACSLGRAEGHVFVVGYKVGVDVVVRHFVTLMALRQIVEVHVVNGLSVWWHQDFMSRLAVSKVGLCRH